MVPGVDGTFPQGCAQPLPHSSVCPQAVREREDLAVWEARTVDWAPVSEGAREAQALFCGTG